MVIKINVGSLFSGIGGIELGFERSGFKTLWFVENDLYAQAILRKHFPDATIYGDITKIDFSTVPKVDILTGGFPCQDISNAGRRAGIAGSRSSLWKYYAEAIRILRPRYAFIENVSALAGRGLNVVLADLASLGYNAEWHCVPASSVGAPHRRDRLFIIAYTNSSGFIHRKSEEHSDKRRLETQPWTVQGCATLSIPDNNNHGKQCEKIVCETILSNIPNSIKSGLERQCISERVQKTYSKHSEYGWWAVEPDVGRVAHGISSRVDRIRCLGNAVVPAVAEVFARAIKGE